MLVLLVVVQWWAAALFLLAQQLEGADRLGQDAAFGVARLGLAERGRAARVQHPALGSEVALDGAEKADAHVHGEHAGSDVVVASHRHAHHQVEHGHEHATVRGVPAVREFGPVLERHDGAHAALLDQPYAQVPDEGKGDAELGAGAHQTTLEPPSTATIWPVMWREASEASSTAMPLRSCSSPRRASGVRAITFGPTSSRKLRVIFEGKKPGATAFTVILYSPPSPASARVKFTRPPLVVL